MAKMEKMMNSKASMSQPKASAYQKTGDAQSKAKSAKKATSNATKNENVFMNASQKMQEAMKNMNPFSNTAESTFKNFQHQGDMPKMDQDKMMNIHKKNMETLNEANKLALDVMRQIATLQGQFMTQTFQEVDQIIRENLAFKNTNPQETVKKQTDRFQGAVQRAMDHSKNVSQVMLKSNQELFKSVQNRFEEGMKEMNSSFNKTKH
ncbi:MAG: phasin family protein [Proteobacteria bacterium]|nr:phasin family protein [Pseudomonadota bacterium]